MRDPQGWLEVRSDGVRRHLAGELPKDHFLFSPLAKRWADEGLLIPFEFSDGRTVVSPRVEFVTYPFEWSADQLHRAATLTLRLQDEAVAAGFDLKDASAWNILFQGARPVFCDHLSFVPLVLRRWWAAGQFSRHFVLPLAGAQRQLLQVHQCFQLWRDGIPSDAARSLWGVSRFFGRYWPLMADAESGSASMRPERPAEGAQAAAGQALVDYRRRLHASLGWMLQGCASTPAQRRPAGPWVGYVQSRDHYLHSSAAAKKERVVRWLADLRAAWVLDLGCNTGEFSRLAAETQAQVVALDADPACINELSAHDGGSGRIHPLVASLDDLCGGRGWQGQEVQGLPQRLEGRFDLVMLLALVHHLAVASSIPMQGIAEFVARCSRSWVIVEAIGAQDQQLRQMCEQRQRDPQEFGLPLQLQAWQDAGFDVVDQLQLEPVDRCLLLLKKRA